MDKTNKNDTIWTTCLEQNENTQGENKDTNSINDYDGHKDKKEKCNIEIVR